VALASFFTTALSALPVQALAQVSPAPAPERGVELSVGGTFLAPAPAGSSSADLITSSGSRLTLFDVESRYGIGYGGDATLGFRLSPALWFEVAGGYTWTKAKSEITDDLEDAADVTISETISRASAEGALVWYFADRGTSAFFIRGSGGWMRELAGGNSLVEDGIIGSGGAGFRRWWRQNRPGGLKRIGLRLEGRLIVRAKGLEFGSANLRLTPAASGLIVFGF
jgi:hypothetical protein